MRNIRLFALVLVLILKVSLYFSQGNGRRIRVRSHSPERLVHQENSGTEGEMMKMDYREPGANTNPRSLALLNSPTSPPVP